MPKRLAIAILFALVASTLIAKSYTPKANTRADIKAYVERAAKVVAKHGPSCDTFASKGWRAGDYYVFVTGPDDRVLCHPNASIVGKLESEIIDANGKKVGSEIDAKAKAGGGWVDYVWPRPGQTTPVPKSSYAKQVKGPDGKMYVVGSGGYEVK